MSLLSRFHPLQDRVVIQPVLRDQRHAVVFLPENRKDDSLVPAEGVVRACGPGESTRYSGLYNEDYDPVNDTFTGERFRYNPWTNRFWIPLTVTVGSRVLYWPTKTRSAEFEIDEKWKLCHVLYEEQAIEAVLSPLWPNVPRVLGDRVLLEPLDPPTHSGSMWIPDGAREPVNRGRVIAVGPGARDHRGRRMPIPCEIGDRVLFNEMSACAFDVENKKYMSVREHA